MGIINYAVPAASSTPRPTSSRSALFSRNAYALAMTKRLLNRRALMEFTSQHDAALGYEFLNFYMQTPEAKARGGGRGEDRL